MGKPRGKLTPEVYERVKEYAQDHTIEETANRFGVSVATVSWVKRYSSFKEMRQGQKEASQNRTCVKEKQSKKSRPIVDNPFPGAIPPKPVIPVDAKKAPGQDTEITTRTTDVVEGHNVYWWSAEYKKLKAAYDKLSECSDRMRLENSVAKGGDSDIDPSKFITIQMNDTKIHIPLPQ